MIKKKRRYIKKNKIKKKLKPRLNKKIKSQLPKTRKKRKIKKIIPVVVVTPPPISSLLIKVKKPRKRRTKNPTRMYFTQSTEDFIVLYNVEEDIDIREQIFQEHILYPFQKLVENIFNTFKFSYFETGPLDVQKECLTHLVANIHKYKQEKGKAYSYFSIIAKHYFILLNNTNYKKFNQNVEISEERDEHTVQLQHTDKHHVQREINDFVRLIIEFWENNVEKIFTKERDIGIANAVVELFRNSKNISMFNKKALYLYIREMTDCRTQQITKILNRMKQYQTKMKQSYQLNGVVNTEVLP